MNLLILISLVLQLAEGQEAPAITTRAYTNVTYRTNFCPLHAKVENENMERKNALSNMNISVALFEYQLNADGLIDDEDPAIGIKIMDEIARRGNFRWRNNYGVLAEESYTGNYTFDTALDWGTSAYDVIGEWYFVTTKRLARGLIFPDSWYDGSLIMVQKKKEVSEPFRFFSFADPLTWGVWLMLLGTTIFSGLLYYCVDFIDSAMLDKKKDGGILTCIFHSAFTFVGHISHKPKSVGATVISLSTAMVYAIIIAAYTANLTSFLVAKNTPSVKITDIQDVIDNKFSICVWKGTPMENFLTDNYPVYTRINRLVNEEEIFTNVQEGKCDIGLTNVDSWKSYERNEKINKDCSMDWVGRIVQLSSASFPLSDSASYCSNLARNVINFLLVEMKLDGTFDEIWDEHREDSGTNQCDNRDEPDTENPSLTLYDCGGLFFLLLFLSLIAIAFSVGTYFLTPKAERIDVKTTFRDSLFVKTLSPKEISKIVDANTDDEFVDTFDLHKKNTGYDRQETMKMSNTSDDEDRRNVSENITAHDIHQVVERALIEQFHFMEKKLLVAISEEKNHQKALSNDVDDNDVNKPFRDEYDK